MAKRYLDRSTGDGEGAESHIGNVGTDEQHQRAQTTKQHVDDQRRTKADITTEDYTRVRENLKRAITQIQNNIQKQKNALASQGKNNLGSQINTEMLNLLKKQMQVAEIYSPPRVVEMANKMGMRGCWSLDLTTCDTDGQPWDLNGTKVRNRAIRKVIFDKPIVPIGSPMCTEYSAMSRTNHCRMAPEEVEQRLVHARRHLEFCIKLCEIQWRDGRYFLHEHPNDAGSWQEAKMKRLMNRDGVQRVVGDQCQFRLKPKDEEGIAPARKKKDRFPNECSMHSQAVKQEVSKHKHLPRTRAHNIG